MRNYRLFHHPKIDMINILKHEYYGFCKKQNIFQYLKKTSSVIIRQAIYLLKISLRFFGVRL
ncbi:hypothetical protein pb186bvf_011184 [Paramecium bursaria]